MPFLPALVLSILGGLLTNLAFPYHSWWILAPLGLALLLSAIHRQRGGRAFLLGLFWGMAFFMPLLYFTFKAAGEWLPWIALATLQALFVAFFALGTSLVTTRLRRGGAVATVLLWVAFEQLRGVIPFGGFPWGSIAFSQTEGPLLPLAALGGTVLVSGIVALFAVGIALLARLRPSGLVAVGTGIGIVIGGLLFPPSAEPEEGTLTVAVVQGDVPVRGAEALGQARQITQNYADIVEANAPWDADVMVWPESAADIDPRSNPDVAANVVRAQAAFDGPILLGTQRYVDGGRYNEYILWQEDGDTAAYAKQHPVPFGEYMPFRDFFRRLSPAVDRVSTDMFPGSEPAVMAVPTADRDVLLATPICFEIAYDGLVRESVTLGAEALIVPTNNASFGFTQESTQQLAISRFRAVEHARATIQVSTVGVSAVFLPDGEIVAQSGELYTEWHSVVELPLRSSQTIATSLGNAPQIVVWALAGLWLAVAIFRKDTA